MTYLEILQECAKLAGLSAPTTTAGQTGEIDRLLIYIAQAYNEIQTQPYNWRWMWARGEIEITSSDKDYDPSSTTLERVDPDSWTIFKTADGESTETELDYQAWPEFRRNHGTGTSTADAPTTVTVMPNRNFRFEPPPDANYKVQFDYYITNDTLSGDTDTPLMPSRYHRLIVYDAMTKFGKYEESTTVMQTNALEMEALRLDMLWHEVVEEEFPEVHVA